MKKLLFAGIVVTLFVFFLSGCGEDDPKIIDPPGETKTYLVSGGKYLPGEILWVKCTSGVSAATAAVGFNFNSDDDTEWKTLVPSTRGTDEIKIALPSQNSFSSGAELFITNGTDTTRIMDILIQKLILTNPTENAILKVGDVIQVRWRNSTGFPSADLKISTDAGSSWLNVNEGSFSPSAQPFSWTIGNEAMTVTYEDTTICYLKLSDYSADLGSDIIPIKVVR